jgi:5-(carboxyamino)imidazole ribonucleotide mutase
MKVIIIMGSKGDMEHSRKICKVLEDFGVEYEMRIASAHKTPLKVLDIIRRNEEENVVFITVAGRSNALSGFVDANTTKPVLACPPYSEKFGGADLFSSIRMPSGVAPMLVLEPEECALSAVKILALSSKELEGKIKEYQEKLREKIEEEDRNLRGEK